jgi:putative ABC transport system permease protein
LDLEADAMRASAFFEQIARTYAPIGWMARLLAALVAIAALVSGVNVLQAAVARRSAELAVLRAMGYSRSAILASLVQEVLIVGAAGAAVGLFAARALISGHAVRVSMTAIALEPSAMTLAIAFALTLALSVGAVIPASFGSLTVPLSVQLRGDT